MTGSAIIEVGIGLVLVYVLLSIIITQINNVIVNLLNFRAEHLREGIERLVTDTSLRYELMSHPMVNVVKSHLGLGDRPTPVKRLQRWFRSLVQRLFAPDLQKHTDTTDTSYVDPTVFADVMIDVLTKNPELVAQLQNVQVTQLIEFLKSRIDDIDLERTLETLLTTANTIEEAKVKLKIWFNNGMDQMSDLFKRRVQYVSFVAGLLLAIILNIDSIYMAQVFWNDPAVRQIAVDAANATLDSELQIRDSTNNSGELSESAEQVRRSVNNLFDLRLPIGWYAADPLAVDPTLISVIDPATDGRNFFNLINFSDIGGWIRFVLLKIAGWLATAFAVMQGSDFWFNLLRQLTGRQQSPPNTSN